LRSELIERLLGLVHHSDRGVQYASLDYTDLLISHGRNSATRRNHITSQDTLGYFATTAATQKIAANI